jgi:ATP-dependent helicase Lhr and Lhr-like helicase
MSLPSSEEVLARLHPGLQRHVHLELQWRELSPVQRAAIPAIFDGEDCVVEAPTASGKTEAVLFPALTRAAQSRGRSVQILYLAPLRALLNNLETRAETSAKACGLSAFKWHGDVGQENKVAAFRLPPHLLLTTPESVEALLLRKAGWRDFFADLQVVIVDEAHSFAAGDRGGHLGCLLERVTAAADVRVQRIGLSATVGNPDALLRWLAGPRRPMGRRIVALPNSPAKRTDVVVRLFDDDANGPETPPAKRAVFRRFTALCDLLPGNRSLVFVRSRREAERLAGAFAAAAPQLRVRTHHSSVSKFFREEAESLIQTASEDGLHAIISTSTLELGIDIGELDRVIQMDALASPSSLLQRVGRTGRRPGKARFLRGLVSGVDDLVLLAATVSLALENRSEALHPPRRAFHLLAHQLLCLALQNFGVHPDEAWDVLSAADCISGIERSELVALIDHMIAARFLHPADGLLVVGEETERRFLGSNWRRLFAVFDTAPLYDVMHHRQHIGTLDAKFVEALEAPFYFVLGGKLWRADEVDAEGHVVRATAAREGTAPAWGSFGGPGVPFETAQEAGRLLYAEEGPAFLDEAAARAFQWLQRQHAASGWRPGQVVVRAFPGGSASFQTFAGDRINRTLARVLEACEVGKATANYQVVEVKTVPSGAGGLSVEIDRALEALTRGELSSPAALARLLADHQPLWPFSPFARCLPEPLWAAALVEQSLDPQGLIDLLRGAAL